MLRAEAIRLGRVACGAARTFFPARGSRPEKQTLFSGRRLVGNPKRVPEEGFAKELKGLRKKETLVEGFAFPLF